MMKYSLGIDMSSKSFHVCLSSMEHNQQVKVKASTSFSNNEQGFLLLDSWIDKHCKQKVHIARGALRIVGGESMMRQRRQQWA